MGKGIIAININDGKIKTGFDLKGVSTEEISLCLSTTKWIEEKLFKLFRERMIENGNGKK